MYKSTPNSVTRISPAKLSFVINITNKLPDINKEIIEDEFVIETYYIRKNRIETNM